MKRIALSLLVASACGSTEPPPLSSPVVGSLSVQADNNSPTTTDLVAFQDGDEPWVELTSPDGLDYPYTAERGIMKFLTACRRGDGETFVHMQVYTVEPRIVVDSAPCAPPAGRPVTGHMSPAPAAGTVYVSDGWQRAAVDAQGDYQLTDRGVLAVLLGTGPTGAVMKDTGLPGQGSLDLDFSHPTPFVQVLTRFAGGDRVVVDSMYHDRYQGTHLLDEVDSDQGAIAGYRALPEALIGNGTSSVGVQVFRGDDVLETVRVYRHEAPTSFDLPATIGPSFVAPRLVATSPAPIVTTQLGNASGVAYYEARFDAGGHHFVIDVDGAVVDESSDPIDLEIPDLSALPGWKAEYGLEAGAPIDWSVEVARGVNLTWHRENQSYPKSPYADENVLSFATRHGTLAAPGH